MHLTVCSSHVTYAFQSESTLYSGLSVRLRTHSWVCTFLDIQTTIECEFTLKCIRDMTRTYSQTHRTDKYSEHSPVIWPVAKWLSVRLQTKWFWVRVQLQSQNVAMKLVQTLSNLWISNLQFYAVYFYCVPSWGLSKYIETKLHPFAFTSYKAFSKKQKVVWN